jgi:hypothetical protein
MQPGLDRAEGIDLHASIGWIGWRFGVLFVLFDELEGR